MAPVLAGRRVRVGAPRRPRSRCGCRTVGTPCRHARARGAATARAAAHVLHREHVAVVLEQVVDVDDVRVREVRRELRLVDEHLHEVRVVHEPRVQLLQHDIALERGRAALPGEEHLAHPSGREPPADVVVPERGGHRRGAGRVPRRRHQKRPPKTTAAPPSRRHRDLAPPRHPTSPSSARAPQWSRRQRRSADQDVRASCCERPSSYKDFARAVSPASFAARCHRASTASEPCHVALRERERRAAGATRTRARIPPRSAGPWAPAAPGAVESGAVMRLGRRDRRGRGGGSGGRRCGRAPPCWGAARAASAPRGRSRASR